MTRGQLSLRRWAFGFAVASWIGWAALGCAGSGSDIVAVRGRVMVNDQPLRAKIGVVNFVPDKDKGNTTTLEPTGYLDEDGYYTLYYAQDKKGAPLGWYKVQVVATDRTTREGGQPMATPKPKRLRGNEPPPQTLFHSKYMRYATSGLAVEVVRNPASGAYDLKLTK